MKETIIYGGAFNPPTRAHQAILQACIDYAEPRGADVWLLPSASRQDKAIETNCERRTELCAALVQDCVRRTVSVVVNDSELKRAIPTETYDTVCEFQSTYPDRTFSWVFGADSLATMQTWNHGEWLYNYLPMLVVDRPGCAAIELGPHATRLAVYTEDISSTEVRRRVMCHEPYEDIVGPRVGALLMAEA